MKKSELKQLIREVVEEVYSQKNEGLRDKIGDFLEDPFGKKRKEYEKLKATQEPIKQNNLKFFQACLEIINEKAKELRDKAHDLGQKLNSLPRPEQEKWHDGTSDEWDHDIGQYVPRKTKWKSGGDMHADTRKDLRKKHSELSDEYEKLRNTKDEIEQFLETYTYTSNYSKANEKLREIYNLIGGEIVQELNSKGLELKLHEV
jgi:cell division protein FtsB